MSFARIHCPIALAVISTIALQSSILSAQIHQAPVDTGRMAWGHKNYTRYTTANTCDRVIAEVSADLSRAYVPDTVSAPPGDSVYAKLSDTVIAAVRACSGQFTVEGSDPRELWSLVRIFLVLGNDTQVTSAIDRAIAITTTPEARAEAMRRGVVELLNAVPRRLSLAGVYLQKLEALGPPGRSALFNVHLLFANYWQGEYNTDSIRTHANQAIAVSKPMSQEEQNSVPMPSPYEHLFTIANETGDIPLQEKILEQARGDLAAWRNGAGDSWTSMMSNLLETRKLFYGKKTRPLQGSYWFNHNGVPRPTTGTLSLIVRVNHLCGLNCYPSYDMIKSLHARYGSALDITLVTETQGYAFGSGPLTPAEEAKSASEYFLKFLQMPAVIMVDERPVSTLSDGRIRRGMSNIAATFSGWWGINTILVDREGKIRWLGILRPNIDRRMLDATIRRAMQADSSQSATATATAAP